MGKGLAIVGILGAVAATLTMLVLVNAAVFIVLPVIVAGSIVLVAQRTVAGAVAGLLVLALAVVAALGLAGSVTVKNGDTTDFGFSEDSGRLIAIAGCLSVPMAAIAVRWNRIDPQSLAYVGIFCAAVGFLLAAIRPGSLVNQQDGLTVATGLLPLGAIVSMVGLYRGSTDLDDERPPAPPVAPPPAS
jgi:hypothetical protein